MNKIQDFGAVAPFRRLIQRDSFPPSCAPFRRLLGVMQIAPYGRSPLRGFLQIKTGDILKKARLMD